MLDIHTFWTYTRARFIIQRKVDEKNYFTLKINKIHNFTKKKTKIDLNGTSFGIIY